MPRSSAAARPTPRRAALAAGVAAAVVIHAAAMAVTAGIGSPPLPARAGAGEARATWVMVVAPTPAPATSPSAAPVAATAEPPRQLLTPQPGTRSDSELPPPAGTAAPDALPLPTTPKLPATPAIPALPALPALPSLPDGELAFAATSGGVDTRFYSHGEVERPAQPDSDWNLDAAALDTRGIGRLVFDIFVASDGEVLACTILAPAELAAEAREQIEARLRSTVLQPAIRDGHAVASMRRIEVTVSEPGA